MQFIKVTLSNGLRAIVSASHICSIEELENGTEINLVGRPTIYANTSYVDICQALEQSAEVADLTEPCPSNEDAIEQDNKSLVEIIGKIASNGWEVSDFLADFTLEIKCEDGEIAKVTYLWIKDGLPWLDLSTGIEYPLYKLDEAQRKHVLESLEVEIIFHKVSDWCDKELHDDTAIKIHNTLHPDERILRNNPEGITELGVSDGAFREAVLGKHYLQSDGFIYIDHAGKLVSTDDIYEAIYSTLEIADYLIAHQEEAESLLGADVCKALFS